MFKPSRLPALALTVFFALVLEGCDQQQDTNAPGQAPVQLDAHRSGKKPQSRVVIPPEVAGKWQAVMIAASYNFV